ncbi:SHC-transforming protein 3 [Tupaia chinensis]|uniref:SHC-transforming protein 3 n=1 Tax=Tupaia chinensis TaxID=246437 RepID=L9KFY3_TUPCH|nr:SHC-transforming protein 3 [Tupaia chinensis]
MHVSVFSLLSCSAAHQASAPGCIADTTAPGSQLRACGGPVEAISRVCEAVPGAKGAFKKRKPPSKVLSSILGKSNLQFAGMSTSLTISTASLNLRTPDSKQGAKNGKNAKKEDSDEEEEDDSEEDDEDEDEDEDEFEPAVMKAAAAAPASEEEDEDDEEEEDEDEEEDQDEEDESEEEAIRKIRLRKMTKTVAEDEDEEEDENGEEEDEDDDDDEEDAEDEEEEEPVKEVSGKRKKEMTTEKAAPEAKKQKIIANHHMQSISFASGGDPDTTDYVAYVAKDPVNRRACHILECSDGLAQDVIGSIGQAFELRFKQYLQCPSKIPALHDRTQSLDEPWMEEEGDGPDRDRPYYNSVPSKMPPPGAFLDTRLKTRTPVPDSAQFAGKEQTYYQGRHLGDTFGEDWQQAPIRQGSSDIYSTPEGKAHTVPVGEAPTYVNTQHMPPQAWPATDSSAESSPRKDLFDMKPFEDALKNQSMGPTLSKAASVECISPVSPRAPDASMLEELKAEPWYQGEMNRKEAEGLLEKDGDFLVRKSTTNPGSFVLTGMHHGQAKHLLLVDPEGTEPASPEGLSSMEPRDKGLMSCCQGWAVGTDEPFEDALKNQSMGPTLSKAASVECISPVSPRAPDASMLEELKAEPWYQGEMNRKEAEGLLEKDGDFLVRKSTTNPGSFVLTGMHHGQAKHLLLVDPEGTVRTKDRVFDSISHLINHHLQSGLPIVSAGSELCLRQPVERKQ